MEPPPMPPEIVPLPLVSPSRGLTDRRRRPTGPWDAFRRRGRRRRPRRAEERQAGYFSDRFDGGTFVLVLLLLILTVVDGAMTLMLLGAGCEEANPAMQLLLDRGPVDFVVGKYILTAAGLPFLVIYRNFTLFGTRFRIGYLIPIFVGLYLLLIGYQVALTVADPVAPGAYAPGPAATPDPR